MMRSGCGAVRALMMAAVAMALGGCEVVGPVGPNVFPLFTEAPDDQLAQSEREAYAEDAVRLALRHLEETGAAALDEVNPPAALADGLYSALVRVALFDHPARDSVAAIHTFPHPATREVLVRIDPAVGWTAAWRAGSAETGEPHIDALVTRHELSVERFYEWSIGDYALLRAAAPLNAAALADRFVPIRGVLAAEANGALGDGNDIRATARNDGWRLDYSLGFGDCPAGCTGRYTWSFVVDAAGTVRFLGSGGTPPES